MTAQEVPREFFGMQKQKYTELSFWKFWICAGSIVIVLGLYFCVSHIDAASSVYVWEQPSGVNTTIKVPANFSVRASHNNAGSLVQLWLIADVTSWADEATRVGCEGDMNSFVRESERVRSDLSLMLLFFRGKVRMENLFEIYRASSNIEQSIVSSASNDPARPRHFLVDISDRIRSPTITYAYCYYEDMPSWYCDIETQLGPQIVGRFGLPKGLSRQWPQQMAIMKCVVERMMQS